MKLSHRCHSKKHSNPRTQANICGRKALSQALIFSWSPFSKFRTESWPPSRNGRELILWLIQSCFTILLLMETMYSTGCEKKIKIYFPFTSHFRSSLEIQALPFLTKLIFYSIKWKRLQHQIIVSLQNHYHESNVQHMLNLTVPSRNVEFFRLSQYLNNFIVVSSTFVQCSGCFRSHHRSK